MKFREYRGSLSESLDTTVEFTTKDEMKKYILNLWKKDYPQLSVDDIEFKYQVYDNRCNWDTYLVFIHPITFTGKHNIPVGMADLRN